MKPDSNINYTMAGVGGITRALAVLALALVMAGLLVVPAFAGERFISGYPNITATIAGTDEFSPGDEVTIPVMVQNSGIISYEFSNPYILNRSDLPSTAKFVRVSLDSGDAPVSVRTGPQSVGTLPAGAMLPVQFRVKVAPDARSGTYQLPLEVQYVYLWNVDQYGLDTLQYFYRDRAVTLEIPLTIRPELLPAVISVDPQQINAGTEGYLNVSIINRGNEDGTDAVAGLTRSGSSPVVPVTGSVYIGEFPKNATIPLTFRVAVSRDAAAAHYPVNLSVTYRNRDGDVLVTDPITIGVPVGGKIDFSVVSSPVVLNPGAQKPLEVMYRNTGSGTAFGARARLITVDPFTTTDDTAYLGDMSPGDTKTARFEVTVDGAATPKDYALDSEILYRGILGDDVVSDRIQVPVEITPVSGLALLLTPYGLLLIAILGIAGIYYGITWKRKQSPRP